MMNATVTLKNEKGLHARPAGKIVELVSDADAELIVTYQENSADGSSIMDLLLLAAPCKANLHLVATGNDAEILIKKVAALVENGFGE